MGTNLKVAVRGFLRTPGFTATALLTLALCLGATLTVFSVVDSILLRGLPFPDADRLVTIYNSYPNAGVDRDGASPTNYYERRGKIAAFTHVALFRYGSAIVGDAGKTERDEIIRVTPDFFATLDVPLAMGRAFRDDETNRENDNVAILTDAFWRQHLNADPLVIGHTVRIDGAPRTVVGVLPAGFRFLSSAARLFLPYATGAEQRSVAERHSGSASEMIARLRPGATLVGAKAQVDALDAQLAPGYPQAEMIRTAGFRSVVVSLHADHVAAIRPTLLLLQGGVLILVLIGAANLVTLFLIRASGRVREVAVRRAIGAGRMQLWRDVLVETLTITTAGGVLGFAVAGAATRASGMVGIDQLPLGASIELGGRAVLLGVVATIVLGSLIAVAVGWFNMHGQLGVSLRSETRGGTASRPAQRLRNGFIVAQIALAFVLLTAAGLLGVSLDRATAVSPGFRAGQTIAGRVTLPGVSYRDVPAIAKFADRLLAELRREPGAVAQGAVTNIPLSGQNVVGAISVRGHVARPGESLQGHFMYGVVGDYFGALGIPLREGRFLTNVETHGVDHVAVVDEDFARRYWPNGSALGQQFFDGSVAQADSDAFTIVGVVGAVKQVAVTDDQRRGAVYLPFAQHPSAVLYVVTRTVQAPETFAPTLLRIVRRLDADLPVDWVSTMDARIADSLVARRSPALLAALFAAVALLLAALGTYGVLSFAVAQRRREIGVRLALGALPRQVGEQFLSTGLSFLAVGTLFGGVGAWVVGRIMQRFLFQVPALHAPTLLLSAATMGVVVLVACVLPARRAARVDPLIAMAAE